MNILAMLRRIFDTNDDPARLAGSCSHCAVNSVCATTSESESNKAEAKK